MNKRIALVWPLYAAALLACAALMLTVRSCGDMAFHHKQIENRRAELRELHELQAALSTRDGDIAAALTGFPQDAPDLSALLRAHLPGVQPDVQPRDSAEINGRVLQSYDVRLEEVESSALADFLEATGAARPPVRVLAIAVSPSRQGASGRLQVQLTLVALR